MVEYAVAARARCGGVGIDWTDGFVLGSRGFLDAGWTDPVGRWVVRAWWLVLPWATLQQATARYRELQGLLGLGVFGSAAPRVDAGIRGPGFGQLTT